MAFQSRLERVITNALYLAAIMLFMPGIMRAQHIDMRGSPIFFSHPDKI